MGFTLAAALRHLGPDAEVVGAELVPAVIVWNRSYLGRYAGQPLEDRRTRIREGDVARLLREERQAYDAILLDVDNGPEGMTVRKNDWLYSAEGLAASFAALRPGGILAVVVGRSGQRFYGTPAQGRLSGATGQGPRTRQQG